MNPNQHINRLLLALNENLDNPAFIQHDLSHTKTDQFFTCIPALILTSLEHTPKTAELNKVGTKCLRLLQSQQGSRFSYTLNKTQSYPFDIDDTSVALLAKWSWKQTLTSTDLFQCLQDLIQLESVPGGPYRTWLVNTEDQHWQDIDPVVNLNIGRFLACIDLLPKSLLDFLITTWSSQASSRYYPNHV